MLLTPEQRARLETVRQDQLAYLDYQKKVLDDLKAAGQPSNPDLRHALLRAATDALEHDDRARDGVARSREVTATFVVAAVAAAATVAQAAIAILKG